MSVAGGRGRPERAHCSKPKGGCNMVTGWSARSLYQQCCSLLVPTGQRTAKRSTAKGQITIPPMPLTAQPPPLPQHCLL